MTQKRPATFNGRHFEAEIIVLCVRWYLRYPLSLRQLEEIMAERNPAWMMSLSGDGSSGTRPS